MSVGGGHGGHKIVFYAYYFLQYSLIPAPCRDGTNF